MTAPDLASLLVAAHNSHGVVEAPVTADLVPDETAAYRVQDAVALQLGRVIGWKAGKASGGPACAPLLDTKLMRSGSIVPRDDFRIWRIEAEIMFRLGRDLDTPPFDRAGVVDAIDQVLVGIEIVDSRFCAWPDLPPPLMLADFLAHGAMVVGSGIAPPATMVFDKAPVRLAVDGHVLVDREGGNPAGDIVELVQWLAGHRTAAGGGLRAGDLITTGSYTGMVPLAPGQKAEASFAGIGSVAIERGL